MSSFDNLSQLGYGYGCESADTASDALSHLCYSAPHSLKARHAKTVRCQKSMAPPAAPCPATTRLLNRPSCRGCDDHAKNILPSVHSRNHFHYRNKTTPTTGVFNQAASAPTVLPVSTPGYYYSSPTPTRSPTTFTNQNKSSCGCSSGSTTVSQAAVETIKNERRSRPITVEGKLVDMRCYSMDLRNHGQDHVTPDGKILEGCASSCATAGIPVGVLTGTGEPGAKVYILLTASPQLAKHMNKPVRVQGHLMNDSDGLLTTKIQVLNGAKNQYEDVSVSTPM